MRACRPMPLIRNKIVGYDDERLAFKFAMLNENNGEPVECQISDAAMDELAGVKGTESIARQAQFLALRDAVERLASDIFDEAPRVRGYTVRIFTKHIRKYPQETARRGKVALALSPRQTSAETAI